MTLEFVADTARQTRCDHVDRCLGLGEADARLQPGDHTSGSCIAIANQVGRALLDGNGTAPRQVHVHLGDCDRSVELLGHYAYNGGRASIDPDMFADRARVAAESLPPIGVPKYEDGLLARLTLACGDQAAQCRMHVQSGEVVIRDDARQHLIDALVGAQAGKSQAIAGDIGERGGLLTEIQEIGIREGRQQLGTALLLCREDGNLLRMRHRHRVKQESIHEAEDQGVGANAQRQRDGNGGC